MMTVRNWMEDFTENYDPPVMASTPKCLLGSTDIHASALIHPSKKTMKKTTKQKCRQKCPSKEISQQVALSVHLDTIK